MKHTLSILFVFISCFVANSQHRISLSGGVTSSKIVEFRKANISVGSAYDDLHQFPIHHGIYGSIEYEYRFEQFQLSTGVSVLEFGTSNYIVGPWVTYYIGLPIMLGYHWTLPKDFGITLEIGADMVVETSSTILNNNNMQLLTLGTIGLEVLWKRLKLGVKGNFSLNPFRDWNTAYLHHSGVTIYAGYVLFDSGRYKKSHERLNAR